MGKISSIDAKRDQKLFEKDLGEVKKGNSKKKSKEQKKKKKTLCTILICLAIQEKRLLKFLMIILPWCLKQKTEQLKEQDFKY